MNDGDLDRLLSRRLAEPEDNGFSARVLARLAQGNTRSARMEGIAYGVTAAVAVTALALSGVGEAVARITPDLIQSQPLGIAVAALVITGAFLRWSWGR